MSRSSSAPPTSGKIELETVVNWPLLVSAATLALIVLAVPLVLAGMAAWKDGAVKDQVAARPTATEPQPTTQTAPTNPARAPHPPIMAQETSRNTAPRQVYVKAVQPPIPADPNPIPVAIETPLTPPPTPNPILQIPEGRVWRINRTDEMNEPQLFYFLAHTAKEVDLESVKGTREKLLAAASKDKERKNPPILALRNERSDLKGLPMREGADCQAPSKAVKKMQEISITLRRGLAVRTRRTSTDGDLSFERAELLQKMLRSDRNWFQEDGLSTLGQMLQVEDMDSRLEFVKRLAGIKGAKASVLLARQALFDFSWTVREDAIEALKDRPREDFRHVLLDGLRYPWPPVAAHAAEALAALKDRDSQPRLVALLDEPDPCAPVRDKNNKWVVPEIVRINHLRNCLLCHAPSYGVKDPLRAVVPTPGEPLPLVYYARGRGDFVRADITYLRQDFSQMEYVPKPDKWPKWQRFDYVVRSRELTPKELTAWKEKARKPTSSLYPQKEAVLFALRELTGQNAGDQSTDWYDLLYTLELSAEH